MSFVKIGTNNEDVLVMDTEDEVIDVIPYKKLISYQLKYGFKVDDLMILPQLHISSDTEVLHNFLPIEAEFNTINQLFNNFKKLKEADLSRVKTSKVTDMSKTFFLCSGLEELDLSGFDTSNVTDMSEMFAHCYNLSKVNLSSFNTSKVKDMSKMFHLNYKLGYELHRRYGRLEQF